MKNRLRKNLIKKYDHRYNNWWKGKETNQLMRYVCHYCGAVANCLDHIPALSSMELLSDGYGSLSVRYDHIDPIKVPSCMRCNEKLGSIYRESFEESKDQLIEMISSHKRARAVEWDDDELAELSRNLRGIVEAQLVKDQWYLNVRDFDINTAYEMAMLDHQIQELKSLEEDNASDKTGK